MAKRSRKSGAKATKPATKPAGKPVKAAPAAEVSVVSAEEIRATIASGVAQAQAKNGAGAPAKTGVRVTAPAVQAQVAPVAPRMAEKKPFWRILWFKLSGRGSGDRVPPAQLAHLRASVMEELKAFRGNTPLSGSPFSSAILPAQTRRKPRLGLTVKILLALLVLGVAIALVLGNRTPPGPLGALAMAEKSIESRNAKRFGDVVDVPGLSVRLVDQIFTPQQLADGTAKLKQRLEAYLKPGLADNLKDEILAAVASGRVNTADGGMLGKLWDDAGGNKLSVGKPRLLMADARVAVAEMALLRSDLGVSVPVRLTLENHEGLWRVTDIPGLRVALNDLDHAVETAEMAASGPTRTELAGLISVADVRKVSGSTSDALLVALTLQSRAPVDVSAVRIRLIFADAAGVPLKVAELTETGPVAAGQTLERTLSLPINASRNTERYVAQLPLSALQVRAEVLAVTLPSGKVVGF